MAIQYAVVSNSDRCRAGVLIIACVLAVVLQCFGTGYYQIAPNNTNDGAYITLWDVSLCVGGTCGETVTVQNFTACSEWAMVLKAASAFYVMACVFVYAAMVFAFLEFFCVGPPAIGVILAIIYVIFSAIGWAIVAGYYRALYCGTVLANNHRLHAGWATAVAGCGLVFIAVIFWFIRYCCCNPKKARFSQPAGAPMVTGPVGVSSPAITYAPSAPILSPGGPYAQQVSYASTPVARFAAPIVTSAPSAVPRWM